MNAPKNTPSADPSADEAERLNRLANQLWSYLLVEELVRCGVKTFFVAPGSRSTSLVTALAGNPRADTIVHYDERGAAFAALGYARATGTPAAWVTTSGTAVANGLPAVVEASVDCVPMVLLNADRPPELRQTGANQTIDQPGIFGSYPRWSFDLPAPDLAVDPAFVLTTVDQGVHRARRSPAGPVHLNAMFREPFLPEDGEDPRLPPHLLRWRGNDRPYTTYAATRDATRDAPRVAPERSEFEAVALELRGVERGLVVAGRLSSREQGAAAVRLAESLGWPLLADIGSQARLGVSSRVSVPYYDALLADGDFAGSRAPQAVLRVGGGSVSKRLGQFLARHRPDPHIVAREDPSRFDPDHLVTCRVESGAVGFCDALAGLVGGGIPEGTRAWTSLWREASEEYERRLDAALGEGDAISEPFVARSVSRLVPEGHGLVVASSMPARDFDAFAVADGVAVPTALNRGASGIDGTVATAAGFARGRGAPVTLVIGDLALLHDLNSLALLRGLPITVVAINNDGGGIFSFLPISERSGVFEEFFGTPHGLSFEHAAAMFGLSHENPKTAREFEKAYRRATDLPSPTLIEVSTDRARNVALHRRLTGVE